MNLSLTTRQVLMQENIQADLLDSLQRQARPAELHTILDAHRGRIDHDPTRLRVV